MSGPGGPTNDLFDRLIHADGKTPMECHVAFVLRNLTSARLEFGGFNFETNMQFFPNKQYPRVIEPMSMAGWVAQCDPDNEGNVEGSIWYTIDNDNDQINIDFKDVTLTRDNKFKAYTRHEDPYIASQEGTNDMSARLEICLGEYCSLLTLVVAVH